MSEVHHHFAPKLVDIGRMIPLFQKIVSVSIPKYHVRKLGRDVLPKPVLKNPHLSNKLSRLFTDVKFWSVQTQNSVETLFISERANTQLFKTPKIFEIDALFMKIEGFLY